MCALDCCVFCHVDLQQMSSGNGHEAGLEHIYAEGIDFTITDLVLFPCVNYLLVSLHANVHV